MGLNLSRRQLIAGAGSLAALGLMGLTGCGDNGVKGKTLYSVSFYEGGKLGVEQGEASTIAFDDADGWHFTGTTQMSGTWMQDGDDIVLTSSKGSTMTLVKLDEGDGYEMTGIDDLGERYYLDEQAAQSYCDERINGLPDEVRGLLEGRGWEANEYGGQTVKETLSFGDGEIAYTSGEYPTEGIYAGAAPDENSWEASDHSGACEVTVEDLEATTSANPSLKYSGTLTVEGQLVEYELGNSAFKGRMQLVLGDLVFYADK